MWFCSREQGHLCVLYSIQHLNKFYIIIIIFYSTLKFRHNKIILNVLLFKITLMSGYVPQNHCNVYRWECRNNLYLRSLLIMLYSELGEVFWMAFLCGKRLDSKSPSNNFLPVILSRIKKYMTFCHPSWSYLLNILHSFFLRMFPSLIF